MLSAALAAYYADMQAIKKFSYQRKASTKQENIRTGAAAVGTNVSKDYIAMF